MEMEMKWQDAQLEGAIHNHYCNQDKTEGAVNGCTSLFVERDF